MPLSLTSSPNSPLSGPPTARRLDRISGLETQLTGIAENMAILMAAVKGGSYGKGNGPYGKDAGQGKSKTLIQVSEVAATGGASASSAAAPTDGAMDTTNSEQTTSAKLTEA